MKYLGFMHNYLFSTYYYSIYIAKFNSKRLIFLLENAYPNTRQIIWGDPVTIGMAVRERILQLCAQRGITINKLSTRSGVTQSTLNNIISKRNRSTTVSTIKKLCDGLDITIIEFFDNELFENLEQEIK